MAKAQIPQAASAWVQSVQRPGAKHGNGAYWGRKGEAKKESSRTRLKNWRREIREELARESQR